MKAVHDFTDPISRHIRRFYIGDTISLWDGKTGVVHPECDELADVSADLDAFYCRGCGANGRISGAWAVDMLREARRSARTATPAETTEGEHIDGYPATEFRGNIDLPSTPEDEL